MGNLVVDCYSSDAQNIPDFDFLQPDADYEIEVPEFNCHLPNSLAHEAGFCMPNIDYFDRS